jgi:hypothetical protein
VRRYADVSRLAKPLVHAAVRVCIDLRLFEKMQEDSGRAKGVEQLAKMTSADPKLLGTLNYTSLS